MNRVEGQRNLGVDEGFVSDRDGFYDIRLHLVGGDPSAPEQGFAAVQHHDINLQRSIASGRGQRSDWTAQVREYDVFLGGLF